MRTKKIRGHRRRWTSVEAWVNAHKNLDIEYLKFYQRENLKILIHPWSGISLANVKTPEPKGETKQKILQGLIAIYDSWKKTLDKLGEPYYLKLWLFEPRFSNSQVVCAIGGSLNFYDDTFFKSNSLQELNAQHYGPLAAQISKFKWEHRIDEDHYDNSESENLMMFATLADYQSYKSWFEKLLKQPHRTTKFNDEIGDATESYAFRRGNVWIGEK